MGRPYRPTLCTTSARACRPSTAQPRCRLSRVCTCAPAAFSVWAVWGAAAPPARRAGAAAHVCCPCCMAWLHTAAFCVAGARQAAGLASGPCAHPAGRPGGRPCSGPASHGPPQTVITPPGLTGGGSRVQVQGQERAGGARSHPSDRHPGSFLWPGRPGGAAVRPDPQPHPGVPDGERLHPAGAPAPTL